MSSPVNVEVTLKKNESIEKLIKRFLRKCKKIDLMREIRKKDFYIKPSDVNQEKKRRRKMVLEKMKQEQETN